LLELAAENNSPGLCAPLSEDEFVVLEGVDSIRDTFACVFEDICEFADQKPLVVVSAQEREQVVCCLAPE